MGGLACRGGEGEVDREHSCLHIPCNMQEVCHTYQRVMSQVSTSHVTHKNEPVRYFEEKNAIVNVCTHLVYSMYVRMYYSKCVHILIKVYV